MLRKFRQIYEVAIIPILGYGISNGDRYSRKCVLNVNHREAVETFNNLITVSDVEELFSLILTVTLLQ